MGIGGAVGLGGTGGGPTGGGGGGGSAGPLLTAIVPTLGRSIFADGGGGAPPYWKILRIDAAGSPFCTLARRSSRRVGSMVAGSGRSSGRSQPWRGLISPLALALPRPPRRESPRDVAGAGALLTGSARTGGRYDCTGAGLPESPANTFM